jgi:hypothetical protein
VRCVHESPSRRGRRELRGERAHPRVAGVARERRLGPERGDGVAVRHRQAPPERGEHRRHVAEEPRHLRTHAGQGRIARPAGLIAQLGAERRGGRGERALGARAVPQGRREPRVRQPEVLAPLRRRGRGESPGEREAARQERPRARRVAAPQQERRLLGVEAQRVLRALRVERGRRAGEQRVARRPVGVPHELHRRAQHEERPVVRAEPSPVRLVRAQRTGDPRAVADGRGQPGGAQLAAARCRIEHLEPRDQLARVAVAAQRERRHERPVERPRGARRQPERLARPGPRGRRVAGLVLDDREQHAELRARRVRPDGALDERALGRRPAVRLLVAAERVDGAHVARVQRERAAGEHRGRVDQGRAPLVVPHRLQHGGRPAPRLGGVGSRR